MAPTRRRRSRLSTVKGQYRKTANKKAAAEAARTSTTPEKIINAKDSDGGDFAYERILGKKIVGRRAYYQVQWESVWYRFGKEEESTILPLKIRKDFMRRSGSPLEVQNSSAGIEKIIEAREAKGKMEFKVEFAPEWVEERQFTSRELIDSFEGSQTADLGNIPDSDGSDTDETENQHPSRDSSEEPEILSVTVSKSPSHRSPLLSQDNVVPASKTRSGRKPPAKRSAPAAAKTAANTRSRGRPPKSTPTPDESEDEDTTKTEAKPRGRGRPPKNSPTKHSVKTATKTAARGKAAKRSPSPEEAEANKSESDESAAEEPPVLVTPPRGSMADPAATTPLSSRRSLLRPVPQRSSPRKYQHDVSNGSSRASTSQARQQYRRTLQKPSPNKSRRTETISSDSDEASKPIAPPEQKVWKRPGILSPLKKRFPPTGTSSSEFNNDSDNSTASDDSSVVFSDNEASRDSSPESTPPRKEPTRKSVRLASEEESESEESDAESETPSDIRKSFRSSQNSDQFVSTEEELESEKSEDEDSGNESSPLQLPPRKKPAERKSQQSPQKSKSTSAPAEESEESDGPSAKPSTSRKSNQRAQRKSSPKPSTSKAPATRKSQRNAQKLERRSAAAASSEDEADASPKPSTSRASTGRKQSPKKSSPRKSQALSKRQQSPSNSAEDSDAAPVVVPPKRPRISGQEENSQRRRSSRVSIPRKSLLEHLNEVKPKRNKGRECSLF